MPLYPVEAPDDPVVTLEEMKAHLRVDHDDEDELIESLIAAAVQNLDGRDGWLGRALVSQSWELRLPAFCGTVIPVPLPPLIAVEEITYYDADDVQQTLSTDVYEVTGIGGFGKARVHLKPGQRWPQTSRRAEPIAVSFRAGYVDTSGSPATGQVPAPIIAAIRRHVATLYEHRETIVVGASVAALPSAVEAMLAPYRVW